MVPSTNIRGTAVERRKVMLKIEKVKGI